MAELRTPALVFLLLTGVPLTALAQHRDIDAGVAAYEEGEFARADELLASAMQGGELSRDDIVRILSHQVLVASALGDDPGLEAAALRLVSLEPNALEGEVPPDLAARLQAARDAADGMVRVEVIHEDGEDGVHVQARVGGDTGGLVREVELRARTLGSPWPVSAGTAVFLEAASPADVEVAARVIGPGGAILATRGTESDPMALVAAAPLNPEPVAEEDDGGGNGVLIAVLIGLAAAVIAGGVVLGVALANSGETQSNVGTVGVSW